jgi:hypothetical protein
MVVVRSYRSGPAIHIRCSSRTALRTISRIRALQYEQILHFTMARQSAVDKTEVDVLDQPPWCVHQPSPQCQSLTAVCAKVVFRKQVGTPTQLQYFTTVLRHMTNDSPIFVGLTITLCYQLSRNNNRLFSTSFCTVDRAPCTRSLKFEQMSSTPSHENRLRYPTRS